MELRAKPLLERGQPLLRALSTALLVIGFMVLSPTLWAVDGLKEREYRRLEALNAKVYKPGKSGYPIQDARARTLKNKCLAMVNKKTPSRHVYQDGSLLFGQGKHPGVFMIYVKTAAYFNRETYKQWSACGYNSINNLMYLRVHRKVIVNRPV